MASRQLGAFMQKVLDGDGAHSTRELMSDGGVETVWLAEGGGRQPARCIRAGSEPGLFTYAIVHGDLS